MLNISVVLPDPEANGVHLPFAKAQARAFAAQWRGVYISRVLVIDEARIMIEMMSPDFARVTITSVPPYMESGVLELLRTVQNAEDTYLPARVRFTPRVTLLSELLPNAKGHKLADGDETWTAAGCKNSDKLKEISVGDPTRTYSRQHPAFCDPEAILRRKKLLEAVPPSVFTGRLRLYVQALYGSTRTDFEEQLSTQISGGLKLRTTETAEDAVKHTALYSGYPTTGIVVIDGKYLLVTISPTRVTYRTLGRHGKISSPPDPKEAYALCGLRPGKTEHVALATPGSTEPVGAPIAYGWHFNSTGLRADIVNLVETDKTIVGMQVVGETLVPAPTEVWKFTHYSIRFGWSAEQDCLTYTVAEESTGLHIPFLQTKIFVPMKGAMKMLVPGVFPQVESYASVTAPIYCYYDHMDSLVVVQAKNGAPRIDPAVDELLAAGVKPVMRAWGVFRSSPDALIGASTAAWENRPKSVRYLGVGATSAAFSYIGDSVGWFGPHIRTTYRLSLGGPVISGDPFFGPTLTTASDARSWVREIVTQGGFETYRVAVIVPHDDASAVVAAREKLIAGEVRTTQLSVINGFYVYFVGSPVLGLGPVGPVPWSRFDPQVSVVQLNRSLTPEEVAALAAVEDPSAVDTEVRVMNTHHSEVAVARAASFKSDSLDILFSRHLRSMFETSKSVEIYTNVISVRTSFYGATAHVGLQFAESPTQYGYIDGWPEESDIPIGWA